VNFLLNFSEPASAVTVRRTQLTDLPIHLIVDGVGSVLMTVAEAVDIVDSLAAVLAEIGAETTIRD